MEKLFSIQGYRISRLQAENQDSLQGLLERCADYSMLVSSSPPKSTAAASMLGELPDGKTLDDKLVVGIFNKENNLIGVLDSVCDYPMKNDWWIGLLLIDPAYRRHGLGSKICSSFMEWVSQRGAKRVFLGVLEDNPGAISFWHSLGFEEVDRHTHQYNGKVHVIIVMQNSLPNR